MSIFNFLKKKSGASVALETEQPEATPVQPTEKEAKKEEPRRIEGEKRFTISSFLMKAAPCHQFIVRHWTA